MSTIPEAILYSIASKRYIATHSNSSESRGATSESYWRWQMETSPDLFVHYLGMELKDKDVLDIGCGIGGRTCYLASQEPKRIVGCDINQEEIATAQHLLDKLASNLKNKVQFFCNNRNTTDFEQEQFDLVLIIDAMEHIENPAIMLEEAYRLVKPGGKLYFGTIGWWHWSASHMTGIIPMPFVQLFFSDKTIINTAKRIMNQKFYQPNKWDSNPPTLRWKGIESLKDRPGEHLNKYTISQFKKVLARSPFNDTQLHVVGFSPKRKIMHPFNFLTKIPLVKEFWHSYLVGIGHKI